MEKAKSVLQEWIINFIKSRDAVFRKLISIEQNKENFDVFVKYKDKDRYISIKPIIGNIDNIIEKLSEDKHYGLVILNTKDNFNKITENWEKLVKFKHLCIYFVNPFSTLDKKWIIFPHTHNRICDESSLKTGLKSVFDMVDPITKKEIEVRFK